jgi:phosphoribosylamine--glycine ligase
MKIMLASPQGDGPWFALRMMLDGHDVSWTTPPKYQNSLAGLLPPPLDSIDSPESYDLIVFDCAHDGAAADKMRALTPVIGSSAFAERLEEDRQFGIEFMEKCGIPVPPYENFTDIPSAVKWLNETKKRCVFKPTGDVEDKTTTYVSKSSDDMVKYLEVLSKRAHVSEFVLQEFVEGTEVSTEGYFNGTNFYAFNHTLEEKKFMPGGIGPNTGCAGNLVWMPTRSNTLYERGLRRAEDALRSTGFVGPIDLNTIVTEGELYGLEWTPRFGYEGTCNFIQLLPCDWAEFMHTMATGGTPAPIIPTYPFAATVRVSVPPYPSKSNPKKNGGVPVNGINLDKLGSFYISDVRIKEGTEDELEVNGADGVVGAPIGCSDTIHGAFNECQVAIDELRIPDMQYRNDIEKCVESRYELLRKNGWLRSI